MYEDMAAFFKSKQWRLFQLKQLLHEHERIKKEMERTMTPEEIREVDANAVSTVEETYRLARIIQEGNPHLTIEQALEMAEMVEES